MRNHKYLTYFVIVLLSILLILSTSCSPVDQVYTGDTVEITHEITTGIADVEPIKNEFQLSSDYVLIRPNISAKEEIAAANFLSRGLSSVTGLHFNMTTDRVTPENEGKPYEYEILIGPTNRSDSQNTYNALLHLDYSYEIIDKNVIVICGGSPQSTLNAARAFMKDLYGYEENNSLTAVTASGEQATLALGTSFRFEGEYPVKTLKLGGVPIDEYSIVSAYGRDRADSIVTAVAELCGVNIKVVNKSEYKPDTPVIFLGYSDADGNHLDRIFDNYTYYITATENNIPHLIIDSANQFSIKEAAVHFSSLYFDKVKPSDQVDIPISTTLVIGHALGKEGSKLQLSRIVNEITIAEGITYAHRLYYDQHNRPVRAHVLTITKDRGRLYTGTPDDGDILPYKNGTVLEEMQAAVENGRKVVAGVNADFFGINGDYLPRGLCIKEGKVLHQNTDRPWFGVLHDGSYVIGSAAEYKNYSEELHTAVGGHYIILKDGKISNIGLGNEFGYTRHPRTAVGFREDGMLVLLVVDGRQSDLSNGASLGDLAGILKELGCTQALNLDGGGSSTFIIDDGSETFKTMNSPSDGKLRKIQNSLLVLLPD